jgi:polyisoprenoid-binding protein YceI
MIRLSLSTSLALLALGLAAPAVAAPQKAAPAKVPASKAAAVPGWAVDQGHSRLGFAAAMNGQSFDGQFRRWAAQIRFDPAHLDLSSVRVVIDTGSAATGDQSRDEALPTADWFAIQAFPRASFTSRSFKSLGQNRYQVDGDLKIRDVSRPVSFPFQLAILGNNARMAGRLSIDRTVFGVGQGQFKGTDTVAAKVDVVIAVTATKIP